MKELRVAYALDTGRSAGDLYDSLEMAYRAMYYWRDQDRVQVLRVIIDPDGVIVHTEPAVKQKESA